MRWDHSGGLWRLCFPAIEEIPGIFHGIFARWLPSGQKGTEPFNLGLGCGSSDSRVWRNRRRLLASFGVDIQGIFARQVHGREVAVWEDGPGKEDSAPCLPGDALTTAATRRGLVILVADCQPVILVDPVRRAVANVHSGWRGSVQNIIGAAVERMAREYGCRPADLICGIGPSLGPCCAEFINYTRELPQWMWDYRRNGDRFDFWRISREQLLAAGVRPGRIHVSRICTRCNQHLFFSYRGERSTGRFAAVVGLEG